LLSSKLGGKRLLTSLSRWQSAVHGPDCAFLGVSHYLDSGLARQEVRLDITDVYVFRGEVGTVFVMNVNSSAP
jgi:hypothetical protein